MQGHSFGFEAQQLFDENVVLVNKVCAKHFWCQHDGKGIWKMHIFLHDWVHINGNPSSMKLQIIQTKTKEIQKNFFNFTSVQESGVTLPFFK
jgi:hypothetical protein